MSKPKRIFLVRHGESEGNVNREVHATVPDWRIPLTAIGRQHASEAGVNLWSQIGDDSHRDIGVYVSPYRRTVETLDGMVDKIPFGFVRWIKQDPRLREQEWGNLRAYEPRRWEDIEAERDEFGSFFYRFMHGESGADVYDRCTGFLDTLYRDFDKPDFPANVLIVTHGYTLRVLLMRWLHWPVDEFHQLRNPRNGQMFELALGADDRYALTAPFEKYPVKK